MRISLLEKANQTKIKPAENKLFWHNKEILYLSEYCGENKVGDLECLEEIQALEKVGFTDTPFNANLRRVGDEVQVFDTEKNSFDSKVHDQIDAMEETRVKIENMLLSKVPTQEKK